VNQSLPSSRGQSANASPNASPLRFTLPLGRRLRAAPPQPAAWARQKSRGGRGPCGPGSLEDWAFEASCHADVGRTLHPFQCARGTHALASSPSLRGRFLQQWTTMSCRKKQQTDCKMHACQCVNSASISNRLLAPAFFRAQQSVARGSEPDCSPQIAARPCTAL